MQYWRCPQGAAFILVNAEDEWNDGESVCFMMSRHLFLFRAVSGCVLQVNGLTLVSQSYLWNDFPLLFAIQLPKK